MTDRRHCEERSDEAIQKRRGRLDCFASLAMTRTRVALAIVLLTCVALLTTVSWRVAALGPAPVGNDLEFSKEVLDRNGKLLRAYATSDGRWRLPATVADVDPRFFEVLFAYEDKRFRAHHGVDVLALSRAALQFADSGRIRSGGSTLTMQVARLWSRAAPGRFRQNFARSFARSRSNMH